MRRSARTARALSLALLLTPLAAQQVHLVTDPRGIDSAIAVAQPGDVIELVSSVFYEPFSLDKGVTIRGRGARAGYEPHFDNLIFRANVPAGQVGVIENLRLDRGYTPFGYYGQTIWVGGGNVRLERCDFGSTLGALSVRDAHVVVVDCVLSQINDAFEAPAVLAERASVTLRNCRFSGGDSNCHFRGCSISQNLATPAVEASDSTLRIEGCTLIGGNHVRAGFPGPGAPAVRATRCGVTIADSSLTAGVDRAGVRAAALDNAGPQTAELRGNTLIGGPPLTRGPVDRTAPLVRLARDVAWRRGGTSNLTVGGDPAAVFAIWLAPAIRPVSWSGVGDPVWIAGGDPVFGGVLNAQGQANLAVPVPQTAALEHRSVWFQAFSGTQLPIRGSTIAGGVID